MSFSYCLRNDISTHIGNRVTGVIKNSLCTLWPFSVIQHTISMAHISQKEASDVFRFNKCGFTCLHLSLFCIFSTRCASLPTPSPGKGFLCVEGRMCLPTVFSTEAAHQELEKIVVLVHIEATSRTEDNKNPLSRQMHFVSCTKLMPFFGT